MNIEHTLIDLAYHVIHGRTPTDAERSEISDEANRTSLPLLDLVKAQEPQQTTETSTSEETITTPDIPTFEASDSPA